uniref:THAP domain containing 7 n=1 Tax=Phasianus colchicus TaxID=9054 RepID=A0A669QAW9_PHACC
MREREAGTVYDMGGGPISLQMPRHCSAAGCCTRDTRETRSRGISFHRLPKKDNPRRALWLENSRRRDASGEGRWDPASKYIYFCSQHFEKSCFEIVGFSGYHRLKEGAVPTVFESTSPRPPRTTKPRPPPPDADTPKPPRGVTRKWRRDPPTSSPDPPFSTDVSCFPREGEDPAGVPALPGPSGARGHLPDTLLVTTEDEETITLPEEDPPGPSRPVSPSLYMLRLPPPAGAYIQSEHSYQGTARIWRQGLRMAFPGWICSPGNCYREKSTKLLGTSVRGAPETQGSQLGTPAGPAPSVPYESQMDTLSTPNVCPVQQCGGGLHHCVAHPYIHPPAGPPGIAPPDPVWTHQRSGHLLSACPSILLPVRPSIHLPTLSIHLSVCPSSPKSSTWSPDPSASS